jgi:hypothetical protein
MRREVQRATAALYLEPQKLKAMAYMDDSSLLGVQGHTQLPENPSRRTQGSFSFRFALAGDHPIVSISRQPIPFAPHLAVKRSQQDITEQRRQDSRTQKITSSFSIKFGINGVGKILDNMTYMVVLI